MMNPYSPPMTAADSKRQTGLAQKETAPIWPFYLFAFLVAGVVATGGTWVWFALERIYNTAKPVAELTAFASCFAIGLTSLVLAIMLHRKRMLLSGSRLRRSVQCVLVLLATLPCALTLWAIVEELYEIFT